MGCLVSALNNKWIRGCMRAPFFLLHPTPIAPGTKKSSDMAALSRFVKHKYQEDLIFLTFIGAILTGVALRACAM